MEYGGAEGFVGECLSPAPDVKCMSTNSGLFTCFFLMLRLTTKGRVREHLVHELMVPCVTRQSERPSRDVLQLVGRVLLVESLRRLRRWLPLLMGGTNRVRKKKTKRGLGGSRTRYSLVPGSCWRCARAGCGAPVLPSRDFAGPASPARLAARLHPPPRSAAWPQRDREGERAALAFHREQRRLVRCAGAGDTAELVEPAEEVGRLQFGQGVKLWGLWYG